MMGTGVSNYWNF